MTPDPYWLPEEGSVKRWFLEMALEQLHKEAAGAAFRTDYWCETEEDAGWFYYWSFPGCLPEGDPVGPFPNEPAAILAAWDTHVWRSA